VIYLDSSVALAAVFAETRQPPDALWSEPLISSRLLEYEVMTRMHARTLGSAAIDAVRVVIDATVLVELSPVVLARALEPFPVAVRTLDGLHLATMDFLRGRGQTVQLASYDQRLNAAAEALGFPLFPI